MDKIEACGIEVSARELVVALEKKGGLRRFANTPAGHRALLHMLTRGGKRVSVCLEATGLYGLDIALALSEQVGLEVMVANPRAVRHFAQAMMQRSKNDQLDALVLREFAARMPFKRWVRPKQNTLALWAIGRRLEALTALCTAEKNRRHATGLSQAIPASVRRDLARSLRFHQQAMKQLRHALYRPALVASRREPHLRGFYEHLLERGKKKRQALVAVARKLLHAIYGMFHSDQPYDGVSLKSLSPPVVTLPAAQMT